MPVPRARLAPRAEAEKADRTADDASRWAPPPSFDKRPEAIRLRVEDLLGMLPEGRIRVPELKRTWQWSSEDVTELFDSLYRGYPVGTLLLWKRKGDEAMLRLGPHTFTVPQRDDALWVVDGQQRVTALAGVLLDSQRDDLAPALELYFDLSRQTFVRPTRRQPPGRDWIPMRVVINAEDLSAWVAEYRKHSPPKERAQLAFALGEIIREYELPAYVVDTDDERMIRHMLTRVNTSGKPLLVADVFDALHGAHGRGHPGGLREVAERMRETAFGNFEMGLLSKSLRALLARNAATDDDMRLSEGTAAGEGEALARLERALRRVVTFFREDARIPHLQLVPCEMSVVTLAAFFDRHPDPSARSRQLLARWIWRGAMTGANEGRTVTLPSTLAAVRAPGEEAAVSALLEALPERPSAEPGLGLFDVRTARSKLETLALLALNPKDLSTGRPVIVTALFKHERRCDLPVLVNVRNGVEGDLRERAATVANRIVHLPLTARALRDLLHGDVLDDALKSHGISRAAWEKLKKNDALGFLRDRSDALAEHIASFLEARAAWAQSDRPSLKSLMVPDD